MLLSKRAHRCYTTALNIHAVVCHISRTEYGQKRYTFIVYETNLFAISTCKHKSVNYRRNRDYSKQFNWTYELHEDIYNCYTEAREVLKNGYMARMKKIRDELHPELNHFTEKYLRQQATYLETRGYLLQTDNVTNSNTENSNVEINIQIEDTSGESNNIEVTEAIGYTNDTESPPLGQTCCVNLTDVDNELLQTLQKKFFENIEKYEPFDNREQLTYLNKKASDGELKVINAIIKTYFDNLKDFRDVTLDINTVIYYVAVTMKEHLKDVKYAKVRKDMIMDTKSG